MNRGSAQTSIVAATCFAGLMLADLVDSTTSASHSPAPSRLEMERTYRSPSSQTFAPGQSAVRTTVATAVSETAPIYLGERREEEEIVSQLESFRHLGDGWDGDDGTGPDISAVSQAISFVRFLRGAAKGLHPNIHADGSILLETEDGDMTFRFTGEAYFYYSSPSGYGRLRFSQNHQFADVRRMLAA